MASSTQQCHLALCSTAQQGRIQPLTLPGVVSAAPETGDPAAHGPPLYFYCYYFQILKLPNVSSPIIQLEAPSEMMKLPENPCSQNQDPLN